MENSWEYKRLADLGSFSRGVSKHRPRNDLSLFKNGKYPFVQTGDVKKANLYIRSNSEFYNEKGLSQSKLWPKGTLCITIAANIAETGILAYPMCFPDSIVGFTANKKVSSETFMYYIFEYLKQQIQNQASGSIQDNINIEYLTNLNLRVPDKKTQDNIVDTLSILDKKISNNDAIVDKLKLMSKTIYDYWFLQFEFPNEEGKPYKSSGGKMVWNEELKREIPEGWKVGNLSNNELTKIIKPGIDKFEGTKNYLETADVTESNYTKGEEVTFENRASRANMQPTKNSVWFAKMKDSVKHLLINEEMQPLIERSIFSTGFLGLQCSSDSFEYIATYIKSEYFEKAKNKLAHGATQQAINNSDLRGIKIVIPCDEVLTEFHKRFKSIYSLISKKTIENKELIDMKDFLLPLLMNGQVTISKN
ncbi:type I restriction modification protein [Ligilactobacillus agilis]|uniref:restriction endonuclease subunit S n=1 Tax=Ligilactobacillus agilis TaxID=1601 RepID=UPI00143780EF|nr:restriction endonuclease subunit S [Ligilactobacillus agilis]GET14729.1 type I restriction modification protein [Ligilactobacillus agilis]